MVNESCHFLFFSEEDACKPNHTAKNTMKMMNKILETKEREHIENKDDLVSLFGRKAIKVNHAAVKVSLI